MNYENLFNRVFDNALQDEVICFLRDKELPFEYCRKALSKFNDPIVRAVVASRGDCPDELLLELCTNCGKLFTEYLLDHRKSLPEEAYRRMLTDNENIYKIMDAMSMRWWISDLAKERILEIVFNLIDRCGLQNFCNSMEHAIWNQFVLNQCFVSSKCRRLMSKINARIRKSTISNKEYCDDIRNQISLMCAPLDDNLVDKIYEDDRMGFDAMIKIVANPSASNYALMRIFTSDISKDIFDELNKIFEFRKKQRDAYRQKHAK